MNNIMRNILVPVLLLATVALSSSNILPILSMSEKPERGYGQSNDNIFSSRHQYIDDTNNLFYKIDADNQRARKLFENDYANPDNNAAEDNNPQNEDIYDVKGFRKEQWHNYPRQMDRLNKYLYEHFNSDKRNLEPDDPGEYNDESPKINDIISNEIHLDDRLDPHKPIDGADKAAAIMNPLIVLKIHLACLNKDVQFSRLPDRVSGLEFNQLRQNENEDYESNLSDDSPKTNAGKVKREGKAKLENADSTQHESKNRNKRIFSLWSRLQSLNHKGHELHHRRHLYALYGLPNSEGGSSGGVLTAETRATFMRPPGSPLRWG